MPAFSRVSLERLRTCDVRLQQLFERVVQTFDCSILEGHRGKEAQNRAYAERRSKLRWPESEHNTCPSRAVDVAPYPIDWKNRDRYVLFAGYVLGTAAELGIPLRWGGDWDGDRDPRNERFQDLVHFELKEM